MRTSAGFTLLELMMAISVLFVAIMAANASMVTAKQVTDSSHSLEKVIQATESIIEDIQSRPYHQVDDFDNIDYEVVSVTPSDTRSEVIQVRVNTISANVSQVEIDAEWDDGNGPRSLITEYYHINRGN